MYIIFCIFEKVIVGGRLDYRKVNILEIFFWKYLFISEGVVVIVRSYVKKY